MTPLEYAYKLAKKRMAEKRKRFRARIKEMSKQNRPECQLRGIERLKARRIKRVCKPIE
jgi:hypothetical protein